MRERGNELKRQEFFFLSLVSTFVLCSLSGHIGLIRVEHHNVSSES
jgi:hypothetical protein